jgi:hypothetical protein
MDWAERLDACRGKARGFLAQTAMEGGFARLTPASETSDYARCFHVFLSHTLRHAPMAETRQLASAIAQGVRERRRKTPDAARDKPFRQLLCFSLSALALLGQLSEDPLPDLVSEQLPRNIEAELDALGVFSGKAGSGNQAMFLAIFLLHARSRLGMDVDVSLRVWVDLHLARMNSFGFWGGAKHITHLQFQNGYHQHEILEYLDAAMPGAGGIAELVASLADRQGHFAPYPGGGGCYDYDAVFMMTPGGRIHDEGVSDALLKLGSAILSEQNEDGGFCESRLVRPHKRWAGARFATHVTSSPNAAVMVERLRYSLALLRPKNARIHTHWTRYSRRWDESDLWDTWFRLMALARIDVALHPEHAAHWGFIDYPGIGFHPCLRDGWLE